MVDVCDQCGHEDLQASSALFELVFAGKEGVDGATKIDWGEVSVGGWGV